MADGDAGWAPGSSAAALAIALVSLVCWGSWTNTAKAAERTPFPLFYLDFAVGSAAMAALIFMSAGRAVMLHDQPDGAMVHLVYAAAAGGIFNIANVLLVAGIGLAGLAVAFPVGIGTALVLGTLLTFLIDGRGDSPALLFGGVALGFTAILFQVAADVLRKHDRAALAAVSEDRTSSKLESVQSSVNGIVLEAGVGAAAEDVEATLRPDGVVNATGGARKGLLVCAVSGILMALWSPFSALSMRKDDKGSCHGCLTPYGSSLVFCIAVLTTAPPVCAVLMRWPLIGRRCTAREYCRVDTSQHGYGLLGGVVWATGTICNLLAGSELGLALSYAIGQAAPMVATLWGLFWYREFAGASCRSMALVGCCMLSYSAAVGLVAACKQG
eukprot:6180769-Pleurochrysis_carterae.AAC.1